MSPNQISSYAEGQVAAFATACPMEFAELNKRMMARIYPAGSRISSTNYHPQPSWNLGAQAVSLNFQTLTSPELHLYLARFADNGNCGYLLKPVNLRDPAVRYDAYPDPCEVTIRVISAWMLPKPDRRERGEVVDPFVEIALFGPGSPQVYATKVVHNNGFNPRWLDEEHTFRVASLELSTFVVQVKDNSGSLLGEAILPAAMLRSGYRALPLHDKFMDAIYDSGVMVRIKKHQITTNARAAAEAR
eukprot:Sspe_Gene.22006::Locus_8305_Transcript_1_1_Confidence_1.000_Length_1290::g.22006::m.22006/K05857/PLCD; phosphatidylinositol phospholipase C, delta